MKVLLVDHTEQVGGAEHSLLSLMTGLPAAVEHALACPVGGPLEILLRDSGYEPMPVRATESSLRLHPRRTAQAVADIAVAARQVARHASHFGADVLHANSIRAGLVTGGAAKLTGLPNVVHLRDRLPPSRAARLSLKAVEAGADGVIAISEFVADGFREVVPGARPRVIANPVDLRKFDPALVDRAQARRALELPKWAVALGVIGQITPWKGQLEAVEAFVAVANAHPELVLLIVGEVKFSGADTRYDNQSYLRRIEQLVRRTGLESRVRLLGERDDVPAVMQALDVLLVPSRDEPFGRVVVEALAMGTPVIASAEGGPAEILTNGADGVLVAGGDVAAWSQAIEQLSASETARNRLARAGQIRAAHFSVERHVDAVVDLYESVRTPGRR